MANVHALSDEELEEAIHSASDERAALKEKARAFAAEADRRAALRMIESLSDEQKAQIVGALSVQSEEGVNGG